MRRDTQNTRTQLSFLFILDERTREPAIYVYMGANPCATLNQPPASNEAKTQKQTASFLRAWRLRDVQGLEMGESSVDSRFLPLGPQSLSLSLVLLTASAPTDISLIASSSTIVTRLMMNPGLGAR